MLKRLTASAFALTALLTLAACGSSGGTPAASPSSGPSAPAPSTPAAGTCSYLSSGSAARADKVPSSRPITTVSAATITTDRGVIPLVLTPTKTPCTVNSFVSLAEQGYFNGTKCHRLTTSGIFVLQCGDPSGTGTGGPGYSFDDELTASAAPAGCTPGGNCIYPAGTLAMANSGANTNGSQFFLVYKDSPLPYNYTVFGHLSAAGLAVVQQIAAHGSGNPDAYGNTPPNESVTITKVATP